MRLQQLKQILPWILVKAQVVNMHNLDLLGNKLEVGFQAIPFEVLSIAIPTNVKVVVIGNS